MSLAFFELLCLERSPRPLFKLRKRYVVNFKAKLHSARALCIRFLVPWTWRRRRGPCPCFPASPAAPGRHGARVGAARGAPPPHNRCPEAAAPAPPAAVGASCRLFLPGGRGQGQCRGGTGRRAPGPPGGAGPATFGGTGRQATRRTRRDPRPCPPRGARRRSSAAVPAQSCWASRPKSKSPGREEGMVRDKSCVPPTGGGVPGGRAGRGTGVPGRGCCCRSRGGGSAAPAGVWKLSPGLLGCAPASSDPGGRLGLRCPRLGWAGLPAAAVPRSCRHGHRLDTGRGGVCSQSCACK